MKVIVSGAREVYVLWIHLQYYNELENSMQVVNEVRIIETIIFTRGGSQFFFHLEIFFLCVAVVIRNSPEPQTIFYETHLVPENTLFF